MQHLSASLEKLVKNLLNRGADNLKLTRDYIDAEHEGSDERFDLLTRKGVYPYSYIDRVERFNEGWYMLLILKKGSNIHKHILFC